MNKVPLYAVVIAGLLELAGFNSLARATDSKDANLLTSKQVKELVANAKTPADHIKLDKHFLALAAKYEAEATEHAALADVYRKAPKRPRIEAALAPDTAGHCDQLVRLSRESARAALVLAHDHERMANEARAK